MTSDTPPSPKRTASIRTLGAVFAGLALAALLLWGFIEGRKEAAMERERERPVKSPTRVSAEAGERVVTLDEETQARSGIQTARLTTTAQREEILAYGLVLNVQQLADEASAYQTARAQAEKAEASLDVSRREFARTETLHQDDQIVSTKALEVARAALRTDEAAAQASATSLQALAATIRQAWGPVIGAWLTDGADALARVLDRRDLLVQVTLPPDATLSSAPGNVFLRARQGSPRVSAHIVSIAARTEPRIQGSGFYAVAPAASGLLAGMSVAAFLPAGPNVEGVAVPESAVVLWQGKAWVYSSKSPTTFARREIPTNLPAAGGGYLVRDLPEGTSVVVRGAQMLLSEDLRDQFQALGEGERER
jgi:hypothetical protein